MFALLNARAFITHEDPHAAVLPELIMRLSARSLHYWLRWMRPSLRSQHLLSQRVQHSWWWWLEVDRWELQLSPTPLFLCHFWTHLSQQNEICICAEPCTCMQQHLKYKFVVFSRPPIQSVENTECVLLMMWKFSYVYPLIQLWKKFCRETLGKCLLSILTVYNNNGPLPNILGWDFRGIIK